MSDEAPLRPSATSPVPIERRALATALNAVEADSDAAEALVEAAWQAPRGRVIGITGPPGVGKSTLAGRLVTAWRKKALTVAALCIDPSSRRSGGALLGDRLRMRLGGDDPGVFVRSMAARGRLGGLAPRAFEAVTVMRAAVDRVLVETVGVGQSEVEVSLLADLTVVVIQPGSGDALQFLKAGLMEVFDLLVVNKADLGVLADNAARELRSALRVMGRREVPVVTVSAEHDTGIDALLAAIEGLADMRCGSDAGAERREAALVDVTLERFQAWHGEKVVRQLGGRVALLAHLAPLRPSPKRYRDALDSLAEGRPFVMPVAGERPWQAELEVDAALAKDLVRRTAPELGDLTPEPLGAGWDNTAWLFRTADAAFVFRFPRRAIAVPFLSRELEILPHLAPLLPLPITAALWRGQMDNGWPFGGYRYLEGDMAAIAGLGDADKLALAPAWGRFVRALHDIDPARLAPSELPIDPLGKVDVLRRWDVTLSSLATCGAMSAEVERTLAHARTAHLTMDTRPRVVCHGDLDGRHLVVARRPLGWEATGVIDWGDLMLGDPATDLGLAFSLLDGAARAAFFAAYGPIDPVTEALARFRAIASQAWVLGWALDVGHAAHAEEARRAIARAADAGA